MKVKEISFSFGTTKDGWFKAIAEVQDDHNLEASVVELKEFVKRAVSDHNKQEGKD